MIVNESKRSNLQSFSEQPTYDGGSLLTTSNTRNELDRELSLLRAKNATKTAQIANLQEIHRDNKMEIMKLATQIKRIKSENVVNQCLAAAQIRYLDKDLDKILDEIAILKFEKGGGRISRPKMSATSDDDDGSMELVKLPPVIKSMKTVRTLKGLTTTIDYETTAKRRKLLTASSVPSRFGRLTPTSVKQATAAVVEASIDTTHKLDQPKHTNNTTPALTDITLNSISETSSIVNLNDEKNKQRKRGRPRKEVLKTEKKDNYMTDFKDDASSTTSSKSTGIRPTPKTHCETVLSGAASLQEQIKSLEAIALQYRSRKVSTNATLIEEGVVERLVTTLNNKTVGVTLQHKSLLVLNNLIAYSNNSQFGIVMTHTTLIPRLVSLVNTPSKEVQEQVIWVLDNIVQDFGPFRHQVIDAGVINEINRVVMGGELNENTVMVTTRLLNHITVGNAMSTQKHEHVRELISKLNKVTKYIQNTHRRNQAADVEKDNSDSR